MRANQGADRCLGSEDRDLVRQPLPPSGNEAGEGTYGQPKESRQGQWKQGQEGHIRPADHAGQTGSDRSFHPLKQADRRNSPYGSVEPDGYESPIATLS